MLEERYLFGLVGKGETGSDCDVTCFHTWKSAWVGGVSALYRTTRQGPQVLRDPRSSWSRGWGLGLSTKAQTRALASAPEPLCLSQHVPPKWYNIHISKSFEGAAGALAAHPSPTCQHRAVFVSVSCGSSHLEAAQVSAVNNRARGGRETGFSPFGNVLYFYSVSSRMPDCSVFPEIYCGRCCSGLVRDGGDPGGPGTAGETEAGVAGAARCR